MVVFVVVVVVVVVVAFIVLLCCGGGDISYFNFFSAKALTIPFLPAKPKRTDGNVVKSKLSPSGWVNIDAEGSLRSSPTSVANLSVIRRDRGKWLDGFFGETGFCKTPFAQPWASRRGFGEEQDISFGQIVIKSDAESSHNFAKDANQVANTYCKGLDSDTCYILREGNRVADTMDVSHDVDFGMLYIADTNNSLIRYIDLKKKQAGLYTLELKGVQPPAPKSRSLRRLRRRAGPDTETIVISGGSSSEGKLYLKISVPEGYHFSKEARSRFSVDVEPENAALVDPLDGYISPEGSAEVHFRRSSPSASTGRINCKVYYCKEDEVCLYQPLTFEVPFQEVLPDSAPAEITLPYVVKPKNTTESFQVSPVQ